MTRQKDTPLLRHVPVWDNQPFGERLNLAISALAIHGILTPKEKYRALERLQKAWNKQQVGREKM